MTSSFVYQRHQFHIPQSEDGRDLVYLCGNSLGLMPRTTEAYIQQELDDWKRLGVEGHMHAHNPWLPYHELLTEGMARVVGGSAHEVVVMNSLTVNLHLMMVSFYRPTKERYKVLMEYNPFPSDRYAVQSQVRYHGFDPSEAIIELPDHSGTEIISMETIEDILHKHGDEIALIMIGGVNYYTGQAYDMARITKLGHQNGCMVGFDLAHAAGNLDVQLSDFGPDFAVWCSYKYLNSGPGGLSGCYVNERHHQDADLPKFAGWWGHDKSRRFKMEPDFVPIPTVESWQLSNPPIFQMAAIKASLDIFDQAGGITNLRAKSVELTTMLYDRIASLDRQDIEIITPNVSDQRGCQLSIRMLKPDKSYFDQLTAKGIFADWREPDVIRVAPCPLYNTEEDILRFVAQLKH
jgi:kynureninase